MKRSRKYWLIGIGCTVLFMAGGISAVWAQQAQPAETTDSPSVGSDNGEPAAGPPPPPAWHGMGAGRGAGYNCPPGCPGFTDADGDGRCDNFQDENGDGWCDNRPVGPARGFRGPGRSGPGGRGRS